MLYSFIKKAWDSHTLTTWGSLFIRLSSVLFVLPLVLKKFSPEYVVLWQLFSTITTIFMLLDFGLSATFARMLSFARGGIPLSEMTFVTGSRKTTEGHSEESLLSLVCFARWVYPRLSISLFVFFLVFGSVFLRTPISVVNQEEAAWGAWVIVLISCSFGFLGNSYASILQGMDKIPQLRRWEILFGVCQVFTTTLVLLLEKSFSSFIIVYQLWIIIGALRNYLLVKRMFPKFVKVPAIINREVLNIVWPVVWRSGIGILASHGVVQMSGLVYAQIGTPIQVASYLLAIKVISIISVFSQAPFYSKIPRFAEFRARGEIEKLLALAKREMFLSHFVYVGACVSVLILMPQLLAIINSKTPFVSNLMWIIISFAFLFERHGAMHLQLYSLTNRIVWHIANGISGLGAIILAMLLYPIMEEIGFPLAMLISYMIFYCNYSTHLSYKEYKYSKWEFNSMSFYFPLGFLVTLYCSYFIFTTYRAFF